MIVMKRPAPFRDLAMMLAASPPAVNAKMGPRLGPWTLAARHAALCRSWGLWAPEGCVACAGLWVHDWTRFEAWFACLPEAAPHSLSIVKHLRLTLDAIVESERVEILARVASGWRPGQRLARGMGFRFQSDDGATEMWVRR